MGSKNSAQQRLQPQDALLGAHPVIVQEADRCQVREPGYRYA